MHQIANYKFQGVSILFAICDLDFEISTKVYCYASSSAAYLLCSPASQRL